MKRGERRSVPRGGRPSARPKGAERRAAPRAFSARSARLIDVSPGGLRLETSLPLEADRVYDLILHVDGRRMPVAARALRVERSGETFRASMVFERIFEPDRAYLDQVLVREVAERMTVVIR